MKLHLAIRLRAPPHTEGLSVSNVDPMEGDLAAIKAACLRALDRAHQAGLFEANGCLSIDIQAAHVKT